MHDRLQPATSSGRRPGRRRGTIGYVLKGFPRLSELFISSEIHRLEARGVPLRLFVMKPGDANARRDVVDRIRAVPEYLPQAASVSTIPLGRWLIGHLPPLMPALIRTAIQRPLGLCRATATAAGLTIRMRSSATAPLRKVFVKELWLSIVLADRVLAAGDVSHLHAHFCHGATTVTWLAATIVGVPFSFTAHAKDIYATSLNPADLLRRKLSAARFAVTCTEANRRHLQQLAAPTPVHRVYHGLNADFSALHARWNGDRRRRSRDRFELLCVGRLVAKKGIDVFVEACALLVRRGLPVTASIVGEPGDEATRVDALLTRLGLDRRVQRHPPMPQARLYEAYQNADVFCLPCRVAADGDRDGIPNVLLEAMATGLPVVTTPVSGIPELVADDRTGLIVPPDDPGATADALLRLFDDEALALRLGRAGQRAVCEQFDGERLADELTGLFRKVVA